MHRLHIVTLGFVLLASLFAVFGPRPVFATCANVTTSESGSGQVDTSFPLAYALGEFIILMFVAGLIAIRWTQAHGPYVTKGNVFGVMIILQAGIFLVLVLLAYSSSRSGAILPPSTRDIVLNNLLLSVGLTLFSAVLGFVLGLIILARKSVRQKGQQILLGSLFALLAYVPIYTFLIFTPHC